MSRVSQHCFALWLTLICVAGCGRGPSRVHVPGLDPDAAAAEALKLYDKNGDSLLDAEELKSCPGLQSCAKWVDTSGDGKLAADEIAARVQGYLNSRVGVMSFQCSVSQGRRPVTGAEITLEPEPFLGAVLKPARGTTSLDGSASFVIEGSDRLGVQPGMYRVKISKKDPSGGESLPAKFNTQTTLGVEANAEMLSDEGHRKTRDFRL